MESLCFSSDNSCSSYPILQLIGEYTDNTYALYVAYGIDTRVLTNLSDNELASKAENNDFDEVKDLGAIATACCEYGSVIGLENIRKRWESKGISPNFFACGFSVNDANLACENDHVPVLEWLKNMGTLPEKESVVVACKNGSLNALKWLKKELGIIPKPWDCVTVYSAGQLNVAKWFDEELDVHPTVEMAYYACSSDNLELLEWLKSRGILPTSEGADDALHDGNTAVLQWLRSNGIKP
jgi:hypothetical protein